MSPVRELLNDVRAAGIELVAAGDKLKVRAAAPPPPSLLNRLRTYKPELLRMLIGNTVADAGRVAPEHLADLAARVCLWRVEEPGARARYLVAGPDHNLRELHAGAVPLFTRAHRDYVRSLPDHVLPEEGTAND